MLVLLGVAALGLLAAGDIKTSRRPAVVRPTGSCCHSASLAKPQAI